MLSIVSEKSSSGRSTEDLFDQDEIEAVYRGLTVALIGGTCGENCASQALEGQSDSVDQEKEEKEEEDDDEDEDSPLLTVSLIVALSLHEVRCRC